MPKRLRAGGVIVERGAQANLADADFLAMLEVGPLRDPHAIDERAIEAEVLHLPAAVLEEDFGM